MAEQSEWIGERFQQFKMVIARADIKIGGFVGGCHRCMKLARLALEFGRFQRAVCENEWAGDFVDVTNGGEFLDRLFGEGDILRALRAAYGLQFIHAREQHAAAQNIWRQAEVLLPIGCHNTAAHMAA